MKQFGLLIIAILTICFIRAQSDTTPSSAPSFFQGQSNNNKTLNYTNNKGVVVLTITLGDSLQIYYDSVDPAAEELFRRTLELYDVRIKELKEENARLRKDKSKKI